jgi:hypothetical protein
VRITRAAQTREAFPVHDIEADVRSANVRRRNISFGLAIALLAISFAYITGEKGLMWMMWRDAPVAALLLAAASAFFAVRWWRTPRS